MTKLSKKSLLLFVSALALAAFALPSMASAATFDGVGNHTLTSSNLTVTAGAPLNAGTACSSSVVELNVATGGATAAATGATLTGCTGTGALAGMAAHVFTTDFPWTVTRAGPGAFTIHGIHLLVIYTPSGVAETISGTIHAVTINNATHTVTFNNAVGLTATVSGTTAPVSVSGDFKDDQNSLGVT